MSDTKEIRLSDYEKSAGAMGGSLYEPLSTLAFMEKYDNMILGNIPMKIDSEEGDFEIIDFPEIASRIDAFSRNFCRSFLITGNSGCGKRTLEKYFRWKFYDYFYSSFGEESGLEETEKKEIIDDFICYYEINTYDFLMYSNEKCCDMINSVFVQIKEICTENIEKIKYISFGDVTDILESKKTAKIFVQCIKMLENIPQNMCIITCVYDGEASRLKEKIKSPFIIENLDLPDEEVRNIFFNKFLENHKNFVFNDIDEDDKESEKNFIKKLCEITEEFNFRMLRRLTEYIAMELKGQALFYIENSGEDDEIKEEKYKEFIGIIENEDCEKGYSDFSKIKEIAEKIRKNAYVPAVKNSVPFVVNTPSENHIYENEKNKSETYIDENGEENIMQADTIAELEARNYKKKDKVINFGAEISETKEEENKLDESARMALEILEKNKRHENEAENNMDEEKKEHEKVQL